MKRKRKEKKTGSASRNASKSSAMTSSQPDLKSEGICGKEDDGRDQDGKMEAPQQNGDGPGHCLGLADGQLNTICSEVPLTAVLPACHQGEHHDGGGDVMVETTTVSAGTTGNPSPTATERNVQCPNDTDVTAASITETIDISGDHHSLMDGRCMISDGCESGDSCMDQSVSALPEEANSNLQVSQKSQPLNETSYLPDLCSTPIIPEFTSQLQSGISQSELLVFHGIEGKGGDEGHCQDPDVIMSGEVTCAQQTLRCGVEAIPSQQNADPRGAAIGLDLLDSQLLGALEESLYEPGKTPIGEDGQLLASQPRTRPPSGHINPFLGMDENHIDEHRRETSQADTSPPGLPEEAAAAPGMRGPQVRRPEDASPTVQGLIMELSNINRLIMSTYRDLRQKRVRHPRGRGTTSGKRRREK